jgi:hypothetical protein
MADTSLFGRLKRLFSTDVIIRNVGGEQLKVIDINQIQSSGKLETNSLIDRFSKLYTTSGLSAYTLSNNLTHQSIRIQLYRDYDLMDTNSIIASALDIISEECTLKNEHDEVLQIKSSDEILQKILYNLFYDVLNIEFNLPMWIRNMTKKGDFFLKLEISEQFGVYQVIPYSAEHIIREEGINPDKSSYVKFLLDPSGLAGGTSAGVPVPYLSVTGNNAIKFENYEMAHFRLISDANFLPYGRSYIEPARKTFHQLSMMEDAMLIHRVVRAPEKRIFYINVGAIPPGEVENFMQQTINKIKKIPYVDPQTGEYNLKFNLMNMMEDFYIPVRGNDQTTKIDTAKGLEYNGIEDIEYLRKNLYAALKIPKSFFGLGDEAVEGKSTLASQDIRFARTVERIQRIVVSELYKIALIHLYVQGYDKDALTNFELKLTGPSIIYDQEKMDLLQKKIDIANQVLENSLFPSDWVYDEIFHISEDKYDELRALIVEDKKRKFRLDQIENEGNDPQQTGESYGTPHDLASLYGAGRYSSNTKQEVPPGYDENELGRPKEKNSVYNTQASNLSKDVNGSSGAKEKPDFTTLEESRVAFLRLQNSLKDAPRKKTLIFEKKEPESNFLDESNIKDV